MKLLSCLLVLFSSFIFVAGDRVQSIATHTGSCLTCGMVEGVGYVTVQVCGSTDCCLSRSLDSSGINWVPGQTDTFAGEDILECASYEIGSAPYSITVFHVGTDSKTARCDLDAKLDDHNFVKASCY